MDTDTPSLAPFLVPAPRLVHPASAGSPSLAPQDAREGEDGQGPTSTSTSYKFTLSVSLLERLRCYATRYHDGNLAAAVRYVLVRGLEAERLAGRRFDPEDLQGLHGEPDPDPHPNPPSTSATARGSTSTTRRSA